MVMFNKLFYNMRAIECAKHDFKDICDVKIKDFNDYYYYVSFSLKDNNCSLSIIEKEFANFCLANMK